MLDVRDFGAEGDGIADDTLAIQTAINSGNEILIPFGTYLISSNLQLKSNIMISGYGTIKANADSLNVFTSGTAGIQNVIIKGITIDGGGQVGGVLTVGKKAATAMWITNATNIIIDQVHIKNCGIINSSAPSTDAGYGGFGIFEHCINGKIKTIKITNCIIENIAGAGTSTGDGIYISGQSMNLSISPEDILVTNCSINTVGRHGIGLPNHGTTDSLSKNVRIENNYIANTVLAGIDMEDGSEMIITDCQFYTCGTNMYGTYTFGFATSAGLRTAISTGVYSTNITMTNLRIDSCNIGITYGPGFNKISNVIITNSGYTDITETLASTGDLLISNSQFLTGFDMLNYYSASVNNVKITNCTFVGSVVLNQILSGVFESCTFKGGVKFGPSVSANITWNDCDFIGTGTGIGIKISTTSDNLVIKNGIVSNCRFTNLDTGILINYNDIVAWIIDRNIFTNMVTYGIRHNNAGGTLSFRSISNNQFINTSPASSTAISITEAPNRATLNANYFEYVANCISIVGVYGGRDLFETNIGDNLAYNCTSGLSITPNATVPGVWDRCIVTYNNFHNCSGTKISITLSGNANGFMSNNII